MNTNPGTVTLVDFMGSDLGIVNNARASLDNRSELELNTRWCLEEDKPYNDETCYGRHRMGNKQVLSARDEAVLRTLARRRHGTPFERVVFTFHVDTHIGVSREAFRHRIASYNEMSTRYMKMNEERNNCYLPIGDAIRSNVGKVMNYQMEPITDIYKVAKIHKLITDAYNYAFDTYEELVDENGLNLSREVARIVLPLGMRTAYYVTINLRSLFNFFNLRSADSALYEIRWVSKQMEDIVKGVVPIAYDAWVHDCDRKQI